MERQLLIAGGAIASALVLGACAMQPNTRSAAKSNTRPAASGSTPPASQTNAEPVPLKRVPPIYPAIAQLEGIEGNVNVCFTVEPDGTLADLHIASVEFQRTQPTIPGSTYNRVYDRATQEALKAEAVYTLTHWKYNPAHKDGKPVKSPGTCHVIEYKLSY